MRLFLLFKAPVELVLDWDVDAIKGQQRWLNRLWNLISYYETYLTKKKSGTLEIIDGDNSSIETDIKNILNQTLTQVSKDLD